MSSASPTVALVGLGPSSSVLFDRLVRLGVDVGTEEQPGVVTDVALIGPEVSNPVQAAHVVLAESPTAQIIFLVPPSELKGRKSSLPFIPYLAAAWTISTDEPMDIMVKTIQEAAVGARKRRDETRLRQRINEGFARGSLSSRATADTRTQIGLADDYLATLIAQAPEALVAIDPAGTVLAWNRRAAELLERPAATAIGSDFKDVLSEILPEIDNIIASALRGERVENHPAAFTTSAAERRVLAISGGPVRDPSGKVTSVSLTLADVTARHRMEHDLRTSQQRYMTLVQSLPQLVWTTTPDGQCDFFSQQWLDYTGIPLEQQLGSGWVNTVHPEDRHRVLESWNAAIAGSAEYDIEYRIRGAAGEYRWFKTRGIKLTDTAGKVLHWFGTSTDIDDIVAARETLARDATELQRRVEDELALRRAAEEQLRQSQKMEAVGQLTGGLAHDFNNILAGINGSLEMMRTRLTQGRVGDIDRYLTGASGAVRKAANLTQRLLAFSRRQTLDPKAVDLNALANGMLDLITRSVGPEIAVETVGASGLWPTFVDPGQLENALLNLSVNARDAMPHGGKLTIETSNRWMDDRAARQRGLAPGQYVSLCVSDTGTGMTPDVISKAFDPFYTTKPIGQGTGLGLSMVYGFAGQSGGTVKIYSELGKGTMVCIYLPRHHGLVESEHPEATSPQAPRSKAGVRILLVDDEPLIRMVAAEQLEELGYEVTEAGDAFEAIKILQQDRTFSLLVTDVGLPNGMNGRQLAEAAREHRAELPVLFITGYAENAVLNHGHLDHGMQVLTKPFTSEALAQKVGELSSQNNGATGRNP